MLEDIDVAEFKRRWDKLISDFGLQENGWVIKMYKKRTMWATVHIKGNFFGGFRTTSRCEGLHSEFGKFINLHNNLLDFLQHFFRWLKSVRHREVESDLHTAYGEPDLYTHLHTLERSAADVYTREILHIVQPFIKEALSYRVIRTRRTSSFYIYTLSKYCNEEEKRHVSYCPSQLQFKCVCERYESFGIPCDHVFCVLSFLNIVKFPDSLVLKRWTKGAKDSFQMGDNQKADAGPIFVIHHKVLVERCHDLLKAAMQCGKCEHMRKTIDIVTSQTHELQSLRRGEDGVSSVVSADPWADGTLRNPPRVRTKGRGRGSSAGETPWKKRKPPTCSICGSKGHNHKSCHFVIGVQQPSESQRPSETSDNESVSEFEDCYYANVQMVSSVIMHLFDWQSILEGYIS